MLSLTVGCALDVDPDAPGAGEEGGEGGEHAAELATAGALPTYPTQHPRIYLTPNRARLVAALQQGTPAATRFRTRVDQWLGGVSLWGFQAWNGALLSQLTGDQRYCVKSVATIESQVATAETAIAAGQRPYVASDSYLEIGELIGDLALVYDWCHAQVTAAQRTRWLAYANQAVWNVWNPAAAKWGGKAFPWSGWSIDNPSNNYYYSFLRATMLLGLASKGESAQADAWITKFRDEKILGQLVPRFEADLVGGGSREGTGYGVSMRRLFELYQLWRATTGEDLATRTGHTRASMLAFMHQIMPTLDRVAPTGDHARDATAAYFDYHRDYLEQLIALFPATSLAQRAKTVLTGASVQTMSTAFMAAYDFINDPTSTQAMPLDGLNTAYHAKGIGQIYARSGWDRGATWVNLTAGPYTESHAHQDQGSLMIYKGGWLGYDANVHSRNGLSQVTTSHSLVRIDRGGVPVRQIAATTSGLAALRQGPGYVYAAADVTPAYRGNTAVQRVQRELVFLPPNLVVVYDRVTTAADAPQTWQLAVPVAPSISGARATIANAGHTLQVTRLAPASATTTAFDLRADSNLTGGYRVDVAQPGGDRRYLHVLSLDGSVSSATAISDTGATINLAAGGQVTVRFQRDAVGATLTIGSTTTTLAPGVQTLSE